MTPDEARRWMREAIALARQAAELDEVPVGAVVVHNDKLIGQAHDLRVQLRDPTAHAEVLALRQAAEHLGDWRLENSTLVVTLEPCPMCAGAALLARIPLVVYGAKNPKFGAVESQMPLLAHKGWNHRTQTVAGVLETECAELLQHYFRAKR
ncbi:MAG: tRNA adenosine(34) deaminase TadA [Candidatus Sumerlaeaceae bacterium]